MALVRNFVSDQRKYYALNAIDIQTAHNPFESINECKNAPTATLIAMVTETMRPSLHPIFFVKFAAVFRKAEKSFKWSNWKTYLIVHSVIAHVVSNFSGGK